MLGHERGLDLVGHVDFILFVSISFALGSQCERGLWWNMALTLNSYDVKELYIKIVLFEYVNPSKDDWLPRGRLGLNYVQMSV